MTKADLDRVSSGVSNEASDTGRICEPTSWCTTTKCIKINKDCSKDVIKDIGLPHNIMTH